MVNNGLDWKKSLKGIDVFPKTLDDFRVRTASGGLVSVVSLIVVTVLLISEVIRFLSLERKTTLLVDVERGSRLEAHLEIDFPHLNCELLGVDAHDQSGNVQLDISNRLSKVPIFPDGTKKASHSHKEHGKPFQLRQIHKKEECGSCYGAQMEEHQCCNSCQDVRNAYKKKGWAIPQGLRVSQCVKEDVSSHVENHYREGEGCRVEGVIDIAKVAGNFHIAPGHTIQFRGQMVHDATAFRDHKLDVSHRIKRLSFGERFDGAANSLDNTEKVQQKLGMYEYFVKIVPTTMTTKWGRKIETNQYSVTEYFRESDPTTGGQLLPGVFFFYDMSPIKVEIEERRRSLIHFMVQLCAIIGGVYTVLGLLDSGIYHGSRAIRKRQMGKAD